MSSVRIGLAAAALILSAHGLAAQQPGQGRPPGGQHGMMSDSAMMMQHMRAMDSLNTRLDALVSRMNTATGNQKVTAMADVINELVAQRRMMQEHMRQMMGPGHGMIRSTKGKPARGEDRRQVSPRDSGVTDSAHAEHHPQE